MDNRLSDKWAARMMDLARHVAQWSKDPTTKVGAVLVGVDRRDITLGYNGFPPDVVDSAARLQQRDVKNKLTIHAERNVLDNARFDTRGSRLFCTFFPCGECAKSMISKGVKTVYCTPSVGREPWASEAGITRMLFGEAGVDLIIMDPVQGDEAWRERQHPTSAS